MSLRGPEDTNNTHTHTTTDQPNKQTNKQQVEKKSTAIVKYSTQNKNLIEFYVCLFRIDYIMHRDSLVCRTWKSVQMQLLYGLSSLSHKNSPNVTAIVVLLLVCCCFFFIIIILLFTIQFNVVVVPLSAKLFTTLCVYLVDGATVVLHFILHQPPYL